ncbi:MAG: hypothetical protein QXP12_07795 [Ignisphaera sp.]
MENLTELAFGIAALTYAASIIISRLPLPFFRRHGWQGVMHGLSSVAVIAVLGSISVLKAFVSPYINNLLGVNLDATFDEAISSINMYRNIVKEHIFAVNFSALSLGSAMAVMLLALSIASISGVGVLLVSIANYLISAVFGLLLLIQKTLSAVLLFADAIASITVIASIAGPGMFMAGLVLYATPFARKLGKTLLVVGAGLTLAFPVVITQALPSPEEAHREIEKSREVQAYSIALKTIKDWQGGVRINILDRNGTIVKKDGGEEFHESRVIHYPYFKLQLKDFNLGGVDCSNITLPSGLSCEKIVEAVERMLTTPETGFINTEETSYDSYREGYRLSLTMPGKPKIGGSGPNPWREATFTPDVWVLGMWIYMQGEEGKRDEPIKLTGYEIPEKPLRTEKWVCNDVTCWTEQMDPYELWKENWEEYWQKTIYYKLYSENIVQEGEKTSFVWFTNRPADSDRPLNVFLIFPPVQELKCVVTGTEQRNNETIYRYGIAVKVGEKTVTYFAYLDGAEYEVDGDPPVEIREVDVSKLIGKVIKDGGSLHLKPSIEIVDGGPDLDASPPVHYMEVYYPGGETIYGEGYTCEEAMAEYIKTMIRELMLENSTNPYAKNYLECYYNHLDRLMNGTDVIPEPNNSTLTNSTNISGPPCVESGAVMPITVTVYFNLLKESPLAPWIAKVEWEPLDKDEEYLKNLADGKYFDEYSIKGVNVETHREEWASYPAFKQGLYRDSPVHEGQRLVVAKLQEYKSMSWENNILAKQAFQMLNSIFEKASQTIPGGPVNIPVANQLLGDGGSVGMINIVKLAGYTIALAYGLILFVAGLDTVSWFIGGESFGKKLIGGVASFIHQASGGMVFVQAMRGKGIPSILARKEAKAQQDKMLKTIVEERKKNREYYAKMVEKKIAEEKNKPLGRLRAGYLKATSKIYERILDKAEGLENRGLIGRFGAGMLREASRGYLIRQQAYNLTRDPEYAKKHLDQSIYVKQSGHVMMSPREWAEGFAKMLRESSGVKKAALVDQLARSPEIGGAITKKWILSRLSPVFSSKISAPASFKVASEMSKPLSDSGGYKPSIPYAYTPEFTVSPWRYRFSSIQGVLRDLASGDLPTLMHKSGEASSIPYIHTSRDVFEVGREVFDAVKSYEQYVRPLSPEEKSSIGETLLNKHVVNDLEPNTKLIDSNVVEVHSRMWWEGGEPRIISFETEKSSMDTIMDSLEKSGAEIVGAGVSRDLTVKDSQEYRALEGLEDKTDSLSEDVKNSFWWLSGSESKPETNQSKFDGRWWE